MLNNLPKFFGFTKTGTSRLGHFLRRFVPLNRIRRILGIFLIVLGLGTIGFYSTRNIGGSLGVNVISPQPIIDVTTKSSTQVPIEYSYESRGFSWFHSGADLVAPTGTAVFPIMTGTVEAVNHDLVDYGTHVIVSHGQGYESIYGHLSKAEVTVGQQLDLGTELGKSGSTGFSTGPHLHLEVRYNGVAIDPSELVYGIN